MTCLQPDGIAHTSIASRRMSRAVPRFVSSPLSALARLARNESGAAAIEYGLMAAGMSIALMNVLENIAATVKATFMLLGNAIQ
jgi:pilus assembly protein Flp/PilA